MSQPAAVLVVSGEDAGGNHRSKHMPSVVDTETGYVSHWPQPGPIPPHSLAWLWQFDSADMRAELVAAHRRYLDRFDGQAPAGIYHSASDCPQPIHAGAITSRPAGNVAARHLFFVVS